ncbi:MAG: hypothetical protein WC326_11290 [Candidatus Delongbacteria bacterium]
MKKLLLLGLCISTVVVAFAANGGVTTQAGASLAAAAPLKLAPGQTEDEALYLQLKRTGRPIPAWLSLNVNGPTAPADGARQGGDFASNALAIPSLPYNDSGTTVGYGSEIGNTAPDVFYGLNVAATTTVTASLCATTPSWDAYLRIYTNVAGVPGTQVASSDDACGLLPEIAGQVLAPGDYFIIVEGYGSNAGAYTLDVSSAGGNPCDTYAVVNLGDISAANYDNTFTTAGAPTVYGNSAPDIGYDFTVSEAGDYFFSTCYTNTLFDSDFYLLSTNPCAAVPTQLQYVDGSCTGGGDSYNANAIWTLTPGSYHLVVTCYYAGTSGSGRLTVEQQAPCVPYDCTDVPLEGEAYYTDTDVTNGGCNMGTPEYGTLSCGDELCGNFHTFYSSVDLQDSRDMDWFQFSMTQNAPVTFTANSCANGYNMWVFADDNCLLATQYGFATGPAGDLSLTTPCLPVGNYLFVIAPSGYTNVPIETGYHVSMTCGTVCDLAPNITHSCLEDQENAGPWTVSATVTDDFGLTSVGLNYAVNSGAYSTVAMTHMGGGVYEAAIPNQASGSYVEYYIEALDTGSNLTSFGTCYFDVVDWTLAPQSLAASDGLFGSVVLTWDYPAAPPALEALVESGLSKEEALAELARVDAERVFAGYNVYRDDVVIGTVPSFYTLTYTDVPPAFGTVYSYRVTALWTSGESNSSNADTGFMLAPPTQGGPDAFGYRWMNSDDPSGDVSYSFTDISAAPGAVLHSLTDDSFAQVSLPFAFPFYGVNHTEIFVGSNGVLGVGAGVSTYTNTALPDAATPNNMICAFWDDLYPPTGGTIHSLVDAGASTLTVQYTGIFHISDSVTPYTFQVVLHADGSFFVNYFDMQGSVASATVGLENVDGSVGLQVNYLGSGGRIGDNLSVRFSLVPPCDVATGLEISVSAGDAILNWNDVGGASGYKVYGATDGYGPFTLLGTVVGSAYVDSGAQAAGRRFYQVTTTCAE